MSSLFSRVALVLCLVACVAATNSTSNATESSSTAAAGDACTPSPCLNAGLCVAIDSIAFACVCPPNYLGSLCETYSAGSGWMSSLGAKIGGSAAGVLVAALLWVFLTRYVRPRLCPAQGAASPEPAGPINLGDVAQIQTRMAALNNDADPHAAGSQV